MNARPAIRFALQALAAAVLLSSSAAAPATSIATARPHDGVLGCEAIKRVVGNLNAGRLKDPREVLGPSFYNDEFGRVDGAEEATFLHALRHNEGKPDARPMRLYRAYRLHPDRVGPLYLVVIAREAWHETRLEQNDMLLWDEIPDPHYGFDTSYWLVGFQSNDVRSFREVPEMHHLGDGSTELKHCHQF